MGTSRMAVVLAACVSTALFSGCCKQIAQLKKMKEDIAKLAEAGVKVPTPGATGEDSDLPPEELADQQLGEKLNGYIRDCMNVFDEEVSRTRNRYFSWVDEKKGVTGKERHVYGLYKLNFEGKRCVDAVAKAKPLPPKNPSLEKAADDYAAAITAVYPVVQEANKYYEEQDYKDDSFAKAKELHPKLSSSFEQFFKASEALNTEVEKLKSGLDDRSLARFEKKGMKFEWHMKNLYLKARALQKAATDSPYDKLNLDNLSAAATAYEQAYDAAEAFMPTATKKPALASHVMSQAKDLNVAGKELVRRIRDKKPFSTGERMLLSGGSSWMVDGSPGKVTEKFNRFVNASNSMR